MNLSDPFYDLAFLIFLLAAAVLFGREGLVRLRFNSIRRDLESKGGCAVDREALQAEVDDLNEHSKVTLTIKHCLTISIYGERIPLVYGTASSLSSSCQKVYLHTTSAYYVVNPKVKTADHLRKLRHVFIESEHHKPGSVFMVKSLRHLEQVLKASSKL